MDSSGSVNLVNKQRSPRKSIYTLPYLFKLKKLRYSPIDGAVPGYRF